MKLALQLLFERYPRVRLDVSQDNATLQGIPPYVPAADQRAPRLDG
jgi:hypothetical protein